MELLFELNGANAGTPRNASEIKLISNWNDNYVSDKSEAEVSTNRLEFVLDDARKIINHVQGGLTGGVGIFEGIPYKISVKNNQGLVQQILDGYIDLANDSNFISCDEVEADIKKTDNLDWLTTQADAFSFGYLTSLPFGTAGKIFDTDYVDVPYILNFRPDEFALSSATIALFLAIYSLSDLQDRAEEVLKDLAEIPDLIPGTNLGDIAAALISAALFVAYLLVVVKAIVSLLDQIIEQLYPAERNHRGMYVKTLFTRGCEYLGLTFESSIFKGTDYDKLVLLPQKSEKGVKVNKNNSASEKGIPNQSSAVYNFGDFLRNMKAMFNAQIKLEGKKLIFERVDYWDSKAVYTLPAVETDQDLRLSTFRYNTEEATSNLMLSFLTDIQDENTLEYFKGTNYQVLTMPNSINNKSFVNLSGLSEVRLPFARGKEKTELTEVEKILEPFVDAVRIIVLLLSGFNKKLPKIKNRKGKLNLSSHTTSVDKLILLENDKTLLRELTAKELFENFHYASIFYDPATGNHNQKKVFTGVTVPFCLDDWNALQNNNKFNTTDGKIGEVLNLEWDINNDKATIDYSIKELYTKNIKFEVNEGE